MLGILGKISTVPALVGCLESSNGREESTPTMSTTSPRPDTPSETPTPESELPTEISIPSSLGDRPYKRFSGTPSEMQFSRTYDLVSTKPAVAAAHREDFGDAYGSYTDLWGHRIGSIPLEDHYLTVSINSMICIYADFEQAQFVEHLEDFLLERAGESNGVQFFDGIPGGVAKGVTAVDDDLVFIDITNDTQAGRTRIEHLLDVQDGESTPYYEQSSSFSSVTNELPQGVFTRLYPKLDDANHWLHFNDVITAGQTISFNSDHEPATGITVLHFDDPLDDIKEDVEDLLSGISSILMFPIEDPVVSSADSQTAVITDAVDLEDISWFHYQ